MLGGVERGVGPSHGEGEARLSLLALALALPAAPPCLSFPRAPPAHTRGLSVLLLSLEGAGAHHL